MPSSPDRIADAPAGSDAVRNGLKRLAGAIQETRRQMGALQPRGAAESRIASATDELDAIAEVTEQATDEILTVGEELARIASAVEKAGLVGQATEIQSCVSRLFIACAFQDITAQRTAKADRALRYVEARVADMSRIWGQSGRHAPVGPAASDSRPDAHLMSGPQRPGAGLDQDAVDALIGGAVQTSSSS